MPADDLPRLRVPPWSEMAEQSLLGSLLSDVASMQQVEAVVAEASFYSHAHRLIYGAIRAVLAERKPVDIITVHEVLEAAGHAEEVGGLAYLNALAQSVPSSANAARYAEIVAEHHARRQLIAASDHIATRAFSLKGDKLADVLAEARDALAAIKPAGGGVPVVRPRTLDLRALAELKAPPRQWFVPGWLSDGPSLFAAAGGVGKTLLAQQAATAGAMGMGFITDLPRPFRSLIWACEDDDEELWRRQEAISEHFGIALDAPADNLVIESRRGVDNLVMAPVYGELRRTPAFEDLRQQVNDLAIDVLWLDNVAHLFGGDENVRGEVTTFINALAGLVTGRKFAVVLLAHTARQAGSEFAGSAAWENAVRMRWYLGNKLPDQKDDTADEDNEDVRFLAKRKSNYSARDYLRFSMRGGVLVPDRPENDHVGGMVGDLDRKNAEKVVVASFKLLQGMGINPTDGKASPDFLPRQMVAKGLASGYSVSDLTKALNRLMARGTFVRGPVGKYANRTEKSGLILLFKE